jgi:hypothetical protein
MSVEPTPDERRHGEEVLARILDFVRENRTIRLPDFDACAEVSPAPFALGNVGSEPGPFAGSVGPYRYQFEGEEDLLHLIVVRADGGPLSPAEGQSIASMLLSAVPTSLIWIKPGVCSQHFYLGHDELLRQAR